MLYHCCCCNVQNLELPGADALAGLNSSSKNSRRSRPIEKSENGAVDSNVYTDGKDETS